MKPLFAIFFVAACAVSVRAETHNDLQARLASERSRIAVERSAAQQRFSQEEAACQRRFAVNDCLEEARARRRDALADLRRQEVSLNDEERRQKGAAQQQRLDNRATAGSGLRTDQQRADAPARPAPVPRPS
mgnify:FL=1